jgi:hypothetical protein
MPESTMTIHALTSVVHTLSAFFNNIYIYKITKQPLYQYDNYQESKNKKDNNSLVCKLKKILFLRAFMSFYRAYKNKKRNALGHYLIPRVMKSFYCASE